MMFHKLEPGITGGKSLLFPSDVIVFEYPHVPQSVAYHRLLSRYPTNRKNISITLPNRRETINPDFLINLKQVSSTGDLFIYLNKSRLQIFHSGKEHLFNWNISLRFFTDFYNNIYNIKNLPASRSVLFGPRASRSVLYSSHRFKFISCNFILKLESIL